MTVVREAQMPQPVTPFNELSLCLNVFRPSHRVKFAKVFSTEDGQDLAWDVVVDFVLRWEQADWFEDYNVERIGQWLRDAAPADFVARLADWATQQPENGGSQRPRRALLKGLSGELRAATHH